MKKAFVILALLPLAALAERVDPWQFERFMSRTTSPNHYTAGLGGSGASITTAPNVGNVKIGNVAVSKDTATKNLLLKGTGQFPLGAGRTLPIAVTSKITPANVAKSLKLAAGMAGGWPVFAVTAGSALALWLIESKMELSPAGNFSKRIDGKMCVSDCIEYRMTTLDAWVESPLAACQSYVSRIDAASPQTFTVISMVSGQCKYSEDGPYGYYEGSRTGLESRSIPPYNSSKYVPLTESEAMVELALYQPTPEMLKLLADQKVQLDIDTQKIDGPASVVGPVKTSETAATPTKPATKTTEETSWDCYYFNTGPDIEFRCDEKKKVTESTPVLDPATGQPVIDPVTGKPKTEDKVTGQETKEKQPDDLATDSPLGDVPKLYTPKYPKGMTGVWDAQKSKLANTPVAKVASQLMPNIGSGGTCPSWMLPLDVGIASFGEWNVAPPCWIWDAAKVIIVVSSLLLARALVFGG